MLSNTYTYKHYIYTCTCAHAHVPAHTHANYHKAVAAAAPLQSGDIVIAIPLSTQAHTLILSSQTHSPALGCPAPLSQGPAYHFCLFLFCFVPLPASLLCPLGDSQRLQSATKEDSKDGAQWTPGTSHTSACTSVWAKGEVTYLFIYLSLLPCSTPRKLSVPAGKN